MSQEKMIQEMTQEERRKYRKQLWLKRRAKLAERTSFFSMAVLVPLFALIILFLLLPPQRQLQAANATGVSCCAPPASASPLPPTRSRASAALC